MMGGRWYETTRRYTLRLVGVRSVSPGGGETEAAREALRLLHEGGFEDAYTESGLDPIPADPYHRHNAYAFVRGQSHRTVVLLGHVDTVDTADYGLLEPWALDPEGLAGRLDDLARLAPGVAADNAAAPGDWMFGRGVADMKSGVAATIVVMRHLAELAREGRLPLSAVLLATPDEENESAGVLQAVRFLDRLRAEQNLTYVGAINTDYTAARYPDDPHRYIYTGSVGKLLPNFFVVGQAAHAGEPFAGLDADLLVAELVRDVSMDIALCDVARGQTTPPPVTLHATDLKARYDAQLPFTAHLYVNVYTLLITPGALLERLLTRAEEVLSRLLARLDVAEQAWMRLDEGDAAPLPAHRTSRDGTGSVLTYAALRAEVSAQLGEQRVAAALDEEWDRWPETLDARERCLHLAQRLWALSGRAGPAVVLFYAPPYYPHVAAAPCALHDATAQVAAAHPELNLVQREYFPLLSDMSYLRLDPDLDLAPLRANMPVWQDGEPDGEAQARPGRYTLPLAAMRRLNLPLVNLGPYGRGVHQPGERVLMSYSFGALPELLLETIERLARLAGDD